MKNEKEYAKEYIKWINNLDVETWYEMNVTNQMTTEDMMNEFKRLERENILSQIID